MRDQKGFSILELSIGIFIVGVIITGFWRLNPFNLNSVPQLNPDASPTQIVTNNTPTPDVTKYDSVLQVLAIRFGDYVFEEVTPIAIHYAINADTIKVITGSAIFTNITPSDEKSSIETEVYDYLISLGFADSEYNTAGPDHGAGIRGVEKNNLACLIITGNLSYVDYSGKTRELGIECGILQ